MESFCCVGSPGVFITPGTYHVLVPRIKKAGCESLATWTILVSAKDKEKQLQISANLEGVPNLKKYHFSKTFEGSKAKNLGYLQKRE